MLAIALHVGFFAEARAVLGLAGLAPIPIDDGRDPAARQRRDVAGLAGDLRHMAVELEADQLRFRVRRGAVAGFAARDVAALARLAGALGVLGVDVVAAARDDVLLRQVALRSTGSCRP